MIGIILGGIILLVIICIIVIVYHNKFQFAIIKIDEAENNIDILLQKKLDLLNRAKPIIKKKLKLKDFLEDLDNISDKNLDHFQINIELKQNYNELFQILDDNEKLLKNESLVSIVRDINDNEVELVAAIKFYNDNVVLFNQLIKAFPSNVIAFFCRYKKKDFYNNEKREIYEILKDK